MNIDRYNELILEWNASRKDQRLGQFLMNQFEGSHPDPDIFYEENKDKAAALFFDRYVNKRS